VLLEISAISHTFKAGEEHLLYIPTAQELGASS